MNQQLQEAAEKYALSTGNHHDRISFLAGAAYMQGQRAGVWKSGRPLIQNQCYFVKASSYDREYGAWSMFHAGRFDIEDEDNEVIEWLDESETPTTGTTHIPGSYQTDPIGQMAHNPITEEMARKHAEESIRDYDASYNGFIAGFEAASKDKAAFAEWIARNYSPSEIKGIRLWRDSACQYFATEYLYGVFLKQKT
jgi:hypothetical protein